MPDFSKKQKKRGGLASKFLLCACCTVLAVFLITALCSLAVLKIPGADKLVFQLSVAVCVLSGTIGGVISGKTFHARFVFAAASVSLNYLLILAISLGFGAHISEPKNFILKSLAFLLSGLFGHFLSARVKQSKNSGFSAGSKGFRRARKKVGG